MLTFENTTAILVTRGDVDLSEILQSLEAFKNVIVWDNSIQIDDAKVYGRFLAIGDVRTEYVYVQDDDVLVKDIPAILAAWEPGQVICNMPEAHRWKYPKDQGICLIGFGGCFESRLAYKTFSRYASKFPIDDLFLRECDRVFTALNETIWVDIPIQQLAWSGTDTRMWKEGRHMSDLAQIQQRISQLR